MPSRQIANLMPLAGSPKSDNANRSARQGLFRSHSISQGTLPFLKSEKAVVVDLPSSWNRYQRKGTPGPGQSMPDPLEPLVESRLSPHALELSRVACRGQHPGPGHYGVEPELRLRCFGVFYRRLAGNLFFVPHTIDRGMRSLRGFRSSRSIPGFRSSRSIPAQWCGREQGWRDQTESRISSVLEISRNRAVR